jgi:hypothetical protein
MKRLCFLFGILSFWLWEINLLKAAQIAAEDKKLLGVYNDNKNNIQYEIREENGIKKLIFENDLFLNKNLTIKTYFPVVFDAKIQCLALSVKYTNEDLIANQITCTNLRSIRCNILSLFHEIYIVNLFNEKTGEIFLTDKKVNSYSYKNIKLDNYKLYNYGKFHSDIGLKFTWEKGDPKNSLVYRNDKPRIHNEGIIESPNNIYLYVPTYIGQNGIIKTPRHKKIVLDGKLQDQYPVYAITQVPLCILEKYILQLISSGQLGEECARSYYQKFGAVSEDNIGTFKVNNSDNGIDIICYTNYHVIVHESKNIVPSSFQLSTSTTGTQCSRIWLEPYLSTMSDRIRADKIIIDDEKANIDQGDDPIMKGILEQKNKNLDFYKKILGKLNNGKLKKNLKNNKLMLNGSSIYHVKTPLEKALPFYYCQRTIDAVFECEERRVPKKREVTIE